MGKRKWISIRKPGLMDLSGPLEGETLEPLSDGIYYLVTSNVGNKQWSIAWECRD